jgi:hypothetical protein
VEPGPAEVASTIVCVECGETAHLLTHLSADDLEPPEVVSYRCSGCADLFYVEVGEPDQGMP